MSARTVEFGYHPGPLDIQFGPITVEPLPNFKSTVADVAEWEGVERDWIYAPLQQVRNFSGNVRDLPYSARVFGLPNTHKLTHAEADSDDHLNFHIWALSFFQGIRLTPLKAGFLDATPVVPGKLVDFNLLKNSREKALEITEVFWTNHSADPQIPRLFAAAVHALFLSQNPRHLQFEEFMLLYTAFDACFALARLLHPSMTRTRVTHEARVKRMCDLFGMATPDWADPEAPSGSEVATLRNATIHEALFMDEPLGFALHGSTSCHLPLQMEALICRLLVALIGGERADYVRSPIDTRQRHAL